MNLLFLLTFNVAVYAIVWAYKRGRGDGSETHFKCDKHRAIFRYFAGRNRKGKKVYLCADPLELKLRIRTDPEFNEDRHAQEYEQTKSREVGLIIRNAVQRIFDVKLFNPSDGTGLTETELYNLLADFYEYVKKNARNITPLPERRLLIQELEFLKSQSEIMSNSSDSTSTDNSSRQSTKTESASELNSGMDAQKAK